MLIQPDRAVLAQIPGSSARDPGVRASMQAVCACTRRPQPLHGLGGHTHVHLRTAYACPRSHSLRTRTHAAPKRIAHARFPHARSAQARSAHARTAHARTRPGSLRPGSLRPRSLRPMVKVRKSFRRTSAKGGQDGGLDVEHRRRRPRRTRRRRARRRRTRRNVGEAGGRGGGGGHTAPTACGARHRRGAA